MPTPPIAPSEAAPGAGRVHTHRPRWPGARTLAVLAVLGTTPAFYLGMDNQPAHGWYRALYLLAALALARAEPGTRRWRFERPSSTSGLALPRMLLLGLLVSALVPAGTLPVWALAWRLGTAFLGLAYAVQTMQSTLTRGGLAYLLLVALGVLALCGLGFWWLEPTTPTLADGLWLAFTTAATVGYGDHVPTTAASKIFAVFVVLMGYGVLSLVTAAIATTWVETEERRIEREILRQVHQEIGGLRAEVAALRRALETNRPPG